MEKKETKILNINVAQYLIAILFFAALPTFTIQCSSFKKEYPGIITNIILTIIICFISRKKILGYFQNIINIPYLIISTLSGSLISYHNVFESRTNMQFVTDVVTKIQSATGWQITEQNIFRIVFIITIPAFIVFFYFTLSLVFPYIKQFLFSLNKYEKGILIAVFFVGMCVVGVIYYQTNVFYAPCYQGQPIGFDTIYTSDSYTIFNQDAFLNVVMHENDLRQPLFGVFAMPVALVAKLLSMILFFVPNIYAVSLTAIQLVLIAVTFIFITRILKLNLENKLIFILLLSSSFPYLLFSILMEQYIIAYFFVILTVYISIVSDKLNYAYFGAVSTLLTSGILFPLISKTKDLKKWFKDMVKCFLIYVELIIVTGQLPQFLDIKNSSLFLSGFSGEKLTFGDKFIQYTHFVKSVFVYPHAEIVGEIPSYHLVLETKISILGIIIMILVLISFIINRNEKIVRISFYWCIFSFLILCIVGWGTAENGLILYALYFAWAFIILLYKLIDTIIKSTIIKRVIFSILILTMFVLNIQECISIYQFGIKYFTY